MYCIKCGVKLADTEKECPLCGTRVFHPDLVQGEGEHAYPQNKYPDTDAHRLGFPMFATALFSLALIMVLFCDLRFNYAVTWSGYVIGALAIAYTVFVLPFWFKKMNTVLYVLSWFVVTGLYLLYISLMTEGKWFLSFAFPILGGVGVIITTVAVLLCHLKKGRYFIFGGASIALGGLMPLMEFLMYLTFWGSGFVGWSFYPMLALILVGGMLIFLGINRPARELLERKFFI